MKKIKIQIKSIWGTVLFEYEKEGNTLKDTVVEANLYEANLCEADLREANLRGANLRGANLRGANLRGANLREANLYEANLYGADLYGADLYGADLRGANLYGANLRGANLREANLHGADLYEANLRGADLYGANLRGANLRGADLKNLPQSYINQCSRDMLFVFQSLKSELPALRKLLIEGKVDGTQYEGDCACLIGSLGNIDGGIDKVCETIPFYDKGLHNYGEQWFYQIREGDTPKTNQFAKHALKLIDMVLKPKKVKK